MLWIILLVLLAVSGGVFYAVRRGRGQKALPTAESLALLERTVKDVRPDDILQHSGRDYLVEGVVKYEEDGHTWRAARCVDGAAEHWVLVGMERNSGITLRLCAPAKLDLTGYPPETLEHAQVSYRLAQRGTATATIEGNLGDLSAGRAPGSSVRCRWWRYQAAGDKCLVVEQWGETYRAVAGDGLAADAMELLAAS